MSALCSGGSTHSGRARASTTKAQASGAMSHCRIVRRSTAAPRRGGWPVAAATCAKNGTRTDSVRSR